MPNDRYTHGHHESVLRSHRWRTAENSAGFLLPHLTSGQTILDVGCGPGNITADLATRVKDASVVGIDLAESVLAIARRDHLPSANGNLSFEVGDVYRLNFADGSFDVVYAHQVLQHLSDPIGALRETRRVLKVGGLLAVRDADFGAFSWSPSEPMFERWLDLYYEITRRNGAEANGGRHLSRWVTSAGFDDLDVTTSTWTFRTIEERHFWGGLWADRVRHSDFARQGLEYGLTTVGELDAIAAAFEVWADDAQGVFDVPSTEVLARR